MAKEQNAAKYYSITRGNKYRGVDNSLARPGTEQANVSVRMA